MTATSIVLDPNWQETALPRLSAEAALVAGRTIIDVRSPGEFAKGHIPTAVNVPLFDEAERKEIGTLYKQVGSEVAQRRGTEIVLGKSDALLRETRACISSPDLIVHCWRGGLRSHGFAWLCTEMKMRPSIIEGGYKAYRRAVHARFAEPWPFLVVSGCTGTGKTEVLHRLASGGEQIVDLEALAGHKGSAFGGIGRPTQPTVEQFENDLFEHLRGLDRNRTIWLEDESRAIGRVSIPASIWSQLVTAPMILVERALEERIARLVDEYGGLPAEEICSAIQRLHKRLGGARVKSATAAVESRNLATAIHIVLEYYDKAYRKALLDRPRADSRTLMLTSASEKATLDQFKQIANDWKLKVCSNPVSSI